MQTFVTGATGFVGANLVRLLIKEGYQVKVLARKNSTRKNLEGIPVEFVEGDLLDRSSLRAGVRGCSLVFHVAAEYRLWGNPKSLYLTNVQGTQALIEEAWKAGAQRILYTSSVAAIPPRENPPADETSVYPDVAPVIGHYKKSKFLAEQVALNLARQGAPVVIVNPSTPIGAYDIKPTPTSKNLILDFLQRRMPAILDTGLNLVDVEDVAQGHLLAARHGKLGERYILGGENLTLQQIFNHLSSFTSIPVPRLKIPYPIAYLAGALSTGQAYLFDSEPRIPLEGVRMARHKMFYDSSKAKKELGYVASPILPALKRAVEWFRSNEYARPRLASRDLRLG